MAKILLKTNDNNAKDGTITVTLSHPPTLRPGDTLNIDLTLTVHDSMQVSQVVVNQAYIVAYQDGEAANV